MVMNIKKYLLILLLSLACVGSAAANTINLTGLWSHVQDQVPNAIIIDENPKDHTLRIMGTYPKDGQQIVWLATGKVKDNKVIIKYKHSKNFPQFESGKAIMQITKNGNRLEGSLKGDAGAFKIDNMVWNRILAQ